MPNIVLEGRRVRLRDWLVDDLSIYAHWLQPGHHWQELDGPYYEKSTADEIPGIIEKIRTRITENHFTDPRSRLVIAELEGNRMIGQVSSYWISKETHWLAAGIVIFDPSLWGKGYGFEALGLWADYLFTLNPHIVRLDLQTWSGNTGMMRLASKLDFQLEGRFRNARIVRGEYYDALGYGILREEWEAHYPHGFGQ